MRKFVLPFILTGLLSVAPVTLAFADVVIKVRALNPMNTKETAVIKYLLPKEVAPGDVIRKKIVYSQDHSEDEEPPKQDFNITYDDLKGELYVDDEIALMPKEVVTLEVHVNDVWTIRTSKIEDLKAEVDKILEDWEEEIGSEAENGTEDEQLRKKQDETREFALVMKGEIIKGLNGILKRQEDNQIIDVGVERHIAAYEENVESLRQVQQDIVLLTNLIQFDLEEEGRATEDSETPEADELEADYSQEAVMDEDSGNYEIFQESQGTEQGE